MFAQRPHISDGIGRDENPEERRGNRENKPKSIYAETKINAREGSEKLEFKNTLLQETVIDSYQINEFKKQQHQAFLRRWVGDNELGCSLSFHKVWGIREQIIELLSQ